MYKLSHFTEQDRDKTLAFMKEHSFAVVAGIGEQYPVASHLPLEVELKGDKVLLHGHLMRKTDHHLAFEKNKHVLAIFNGPHCYISASWYNTPQIASTWNYMTVHAKGVITFTDDKGTCDAIRSITEKYEAPDSLAAFDKMPEAYVKQMLKAIVGFTIEVETLDAVFKLSQNRDAASKQQIISQLQKRSDEGSIKIAEEMQRHLKQ